MANFTRDRAKEHFPAVLLTLLSIVQAIALELLWSHVVDAPHLYEFTFGAVVAWAQVVGTLLTVILIWVVYASNVMRFRWVPAITDSIYPFSIGIVEFWLVETLNIGSIGIWLMVTGFVFGVMTWIAQITMRRARSDPDNNQFFEKTGRATLSDFYPQISIIGLFFVVGLLTNSMNPPPIVQGGLVLLTLMFLAWQFLSTVRYWNAAIAAPPQS
jgi:hypothetical protein